MYLSIDFQMEGLEAGCGIRPFFFSQQLDERRGRIGQHLFLYLKDDDRIAIVASNGGRDKEPSWWSNLRTDPNAKVQIRGEKKKMIARKANESEQTNLWPLLTKMYPSYSEYQKRTKREIPVVILTRDTS